MESAVPPAPARSVPRVDRQRHGSGTDGSGRWSGGRVLVLNATFEPINVCTARLSPVLLRKAKAEVLGIAAKDILWANGSLPRPVVIGQITYVPAPLDPSRCKIT